MTIRVNKRIGSVVETEETISNPEQDPNIGKPGEE